jgi:large subunit ribosomal protein L18
MAVSKLERRTRIKRRIRKIISGTAVKPRLSVYRSNKEIYAQLVDDVNGVTIAGVSSRDIKVTSNTEAATTVGKAIAEKATKAGVETVAFDRNGYLYHG